MDRGEALRSQRLSRLSALILVLPLLGSVLWAQDQGSTASQGGTFRLHKFEQPIGEETYTVTRDGAGLSLKSDFLFTDRGSKVPLTASLRTANDYTPQSFAIKGSTSRNSEIDTKVDVSGTSVAVVQGTTKRTQEVPGKFFTISGYAPVAIQMAMMRYWREHGSPAQLATLPLGTVQIEDRGAETMEIGGRSVKVERYTVKGLIWGMETLWMDGDNNLAALVSTDAEFDHFEAVLDRYEPALAKFVASAARDEMAALTEMSQRLPGRRTGSFAFTGATLIDGTGHAPLANATVVTKDGKIVAAGPSGKVSVPKDAQRIDVSGKYIIPGLWDMHAHYEQVEWGPIYLATGVTTVRDVGNEFDFITAVRDAVNSGTALGPHMLLAGIVDGDGPGAIGVARVNSPADAAVWVKKYHDASFQQMKIYSSMKLENLKAVCADAHQVGMTVTGHIPEGMTAFDGVDAGMDQINHINYIARLYYPKDFDPRKATPEERKAALDAIDLNSAASEKIISFFKQHGTVIDPTIALMEWLSHPADRPYSELEPGAARVAPELYETINSGGVPAEGQALAKLSLEKRIAMIGALHRAGVPVVVGTDQTVPGFSVYREMELYQQAGFTPMEVLQAATIVPARAMKVEAESGTVEAGKRADLDILDANPLDSIHNIRGVHWVVANGVLYEPAPLWQSVGFKP